MKPDLAEQIRSLVDGGAPAVSMEEIRAARSDRVGGVEDARGTVSLLRHTTAGRQIVMAAAVVVLVVAASWTAIAVGGSAKKVTTAAAKPGPAPKLTRWQLTADLSGPQFVVGTGNPAAVVGVTCGGSSTCFLSTGYGLDYSGGGGMYVSHDGGGQWSPTSLPANMAITTLVSCASSTWCAAGAGLLDPATGDPAAKKPSRDPELMITADGGSSWSSMAVPIPVDVQQLPAYQNLPAETTYWPGQIDGVSCSAPGVCNVVGHTQTDAPGGGIADELVFLRTTDGGTHWATSILPEQSSEASYQVTVASGDSVKMSCPTATTCIVVGSLFPVLNLQAGVVDVWNTTDAGTTWTEHRVPNVSTLSSGLTCPDAVTCWMVPGDFTDPTTGKATFGGSLLRSDDGGATWSLIAAPSSQGGGPSGGQVWSSISCATADACYLGGVGIAESTDGGSTWQPVTLPSTVGEVLGISCDSQSSCVALASPSSGDAIGPSGEGSLILTNSPAMSPTSEPTTSSS